MKLFLALFCTFVPCCLMSATTSTSSTGNWNSGGNWTNGVPGGTDDVFVNHAMTINTNIATSRGDYTINSPITDENGGSSYNLSISGTGGNQGNFDVNANATFEGTLNVNNNGTLTIRSGDTLTVGATTFANGSTVVIESGGVLIINGNLSNNNNSDDIDVDGTIIVYGNVTGGNGSSITGSGSIQSSGSINLSGSGSIFGSTTDCNPGPCGIGAPPLPIVLNYFHARMENNLIFFDWETLSEINNDYFSIEKSLDAKNFNSVLIKEGSGNSREKIKYQAIDSMPYEGISYYRLKQTDFDGVYTYSDVISIDNKLQPKFRIFPSPSTGLMKIDLGLKKNVELNIYNFFGNVVYSSNLTNSFSVIDLSNLPSGQYSVQIIDPSLKVMETERWIKQ